MQLGHTHLCVVDHCIPNLWQTNTHNGDTVSNLMIDGVVYMRNV